MKQCAVILNGNDVIPVTNLKRKYNKLINNSNIKILEECNTDRLNEKLDYWKRIVNEDYKKGVEREKEAKLYHFRNPKTGYSITSIYPTLDNIKSYCKDWMDYERDDVEDSE